MDKKSIGGYIEFENNRGGLYHNSALRLNSGRNALEYIIKAKSIKRIMMPKYMCDACDEVIERNKVVVKYYSINEQFEPIIEQYDGAYIYIVNYFGQLRENTICKYGDRVIVDNAQAFFAEPLEGIDTLYTCRKWFGVADGAFLYTNKYIQLEGRDYSYDRMKHILGRYEKSAEEFYGCYRENEEMIGKVPLKKMSKLTENMLRGIDYKYVISRRKKNFEVLNRLLSKHNKLQLDDQQVYYMYPFYVESGDVLRKKLQEKKIYVPILWPNVIKNFENGKTEYDFANNILPIPLDQRYNEEDMEYVAFMIEQLM